MEAGLFVLINQHIVLRFGENRALYVAFARPCRNWAPVTYREKAAAGGTFAQTKQMCFLVINCNI